MVEFNKVSTESYFIKNLLYSTFLPLLRTVKENDYIIRDRLYIYKCNIIRCTSSGYIPAKNVNMNPDEFPKYLLRRSDDEKVLPGQIYYIIRDKKTTRIIGSPNDMRCPRTEGWYEQNIATYEILGEYYFGERNDKFCRNFLSSSEGYDYKTHEKLGHYLRSLRDMYGLNLMPLYNCFSNQLLRNIHITNDKVSKTSEDFNTKVYKVPIRFNTDYTICMENVGLTTFAPAFIHHGTLMNLNNNRFGNNVDATNKYIKLNHNDVIHNYPNLRFKDPIKLRFDNVPLNKTKSYSKYVYTEICANTDPKYYRLNPAANHIYEKRATDKSYQTIDYNNPELIGEKIYQPGYEFLLYTDAGTLFADDDVFVSDDLFIPIPEGEFYESINPSIGTFDIITKTYKKCPEDEVFFNEKIFNNNKTNYYIKTTDTIDGVTTEVYEQCTQSSAYDPDEIYYYVDKDKSDTWYEFINDEFVPTQDTYIVPDKIYYKKEMTEVPVTLNYDITEENCCMYDYIEDELYLLIQVPAALDTNIVILEGDYTNIEGVKIFDQEKFELFSNEKLDKLFTKNLILMETATKKIRPFSPTLIQFLLWNAICNLDTINNDLDRLYLILDEVAAGDLPSEYNHNYWYNKYRELVFEYADTFPREYIRDNLGYVTTSIEKILYRGRHYVPYLYEAEPAVEDFADEE